eukprot:6845138-Karenia_brevis.AAC.1
MFWLPDLGGPKITSIAATACAAKVRLATTFFPLVQALYQKLSRAFDDVMVGVTGGGLSPAFWDTDPI